jgi:hypothetical protein
MLTPGGRCVFSLRRVGLDVSHSYYNNATITAGGRQRGWCTCGGSRLVMRAIDLRECLLVCLLRNPKKGPSRAAFFFFFFF